MTPIDSTNDQNTVRIASCLRLRFYIIDQKTHLHC